MEKTNIVLVESEAVNAMEIKNGLQDLGYHKISIADNGENAVQIVENTNPDLVIIDIAIKGKIDGIKTAAIIRSRFEIPVIFLMSDPGLEKIVQAKKTMPFGYVMKPVQEMDLKLTLETALHFSKLDTERKKVELALRESRNRSYQQGKSIAKLAINEAINMGDTSIALRLLMKEISEVIQVERASVWLLSENGEDMRCNLLTEARNNRFSEGAVLKRKDYPHYFEAVHKYNRVCANDAQNDPQTNEFTENYLKPLGITSMLDAGIHLNGMLIGVVCLEHTGKKRNWYPEEEAYTSAIAALIAQTLGNAERKKAEKSLIASEQNLKRAQQISKTGSWYYDIASKTEEWSNECFNIYGIKKEDYPDNKIPNISSIIYKNPEETYNRFLTQAEKNDAYELEFDSAPINGEVKRIHSYCRVERDSNGKALKIFGTDQDITERTLLKMELEKHQVYLEELIKERTSELEEEIIRRKQTEIALMESRERMELALKSADLGMWNWDLVNDTFILDERAEKFLGDTPRDNDDWLSRIHPNDVSKVKKSDEAIILGISDVVDYNYRLTNKAGDVIWVHGWGRVVEWNKDGKPIRAVGTSRDITEQKKIEAALKESEQNLKRAQGISKTGSWYYDWQTNTEVWSDECFKLYGINKNDYPNNIVPETLSSSMYANPVESDDLSTTLAQKYDTFEVENTTIPISGQIKTIHSYCEVEKDKNGNILKVFGIDHDITERKQLENRLKHSKEQAELANKAKSDFLSNISHELRTPMQGILGYSNLAIKKINQLDTSKFLEYFSEIRTSGHRLMLLLNDILDLSKLESGKMVYDFTTEKMFDVVTSVISEFKIPSRNKAVKIIFDKLQFDDTISLDKEKIIQVIRNLIDNGIKFSKPNDLIRITAIKENGCLKTFVIDQGLGIPESELETVFDKFVQSSKTKTNAGGTGLGLAICKEIIEAHNGKIKAENNPEGGATFSFMLPLKK